MRLWCDMNRLESPVIERTVSASTDSKRNTREGMFIVLCLLVPTLLCIWYINTFGVNVVCADEWAFFYFLKKFNLGTFNAYELFKLSYNDHRAFFPILYLLCLIPPLH